MLRQGQRKLDPHAARAVKVVLGDGHPPDVNLDIARSRYLARRLALVGPLEMVASVENLAPTADGVPGMTIFRPHTAEKLLPALVYLHGGCWTMGDHEIYEPLLRQLANATGRAVISVDYRLSPEHRFPAALEDTWNALEWLVANAGLVGINRNRIVIGGDNSGGNMAAVTALAARDGLISVPLEAQLLLMPCLDMTTSLPSHADYGLGYILTRQRYQWCLANYTGNFPDLDDWHLSPLFADNLSGLPPAIVLYAEFDPLRDEAALYCQRLAEAGVAVEPLFFSGLVHGFITMAGVVPAAKDAVQQIARAMRKLERDASPQRA